MRSIIADREAKVFFKNRYNKIEYIAHLESGENNYLPYYYNDIRAMLDNKREIFIYKGEGALPIENSFKKYDFKHLDIQALDTYLQENKFKTTPPIQRELIKEWIEIYELNKTRDFTIYPPYFLEKMQEFIKPNNANYARYT